MKSWMRASALMLATAGALTACEDEYVAPAPTGPGAEVGALRLTLGTGQTMLVYSDGRLTLGPLVFTRPTTPLTIQLLDHNGAVISNVDPAALQVNVGSTSPVSGTTGVVSYDRIDGFRGTLRGGNNPGSTTLQFVLFDLDRRKAVFGPHQVPIVTR